MLSCDYLWRRLPFTGNSRGFGGRELWSFWPASTVDRCASGRAGWYSIVDAARNPRGLPGTRIRSVNASAYVEIKFWAPHTIDAISSP